MSADTQPRLVPRLHRVAPLLLALVAVSGCAVPAKPIVSNAPDSPSPPSPPSPSSIAPVTPSPSSALSSIDPGGPWEGIEWRQATTPFTGAPTASRVDGVVAWGSDLMAYGRVRTSGRGQFTEMAAVFLSSDGERWQTIPIDQGVGPGDTSEINLAARGAGGAVLFGGTCCGAEEMGVWRSPDGLAWERQPLDSSPFGDGVIVTFDMAAIDDGFAIVGQKVVGRVGSEEVRAAIWTSPDGRRWQEVDPAAAGLGPGGIGGIAFFGGRWLAAGWQDDGTSYDGALWESTDGTEWRRAQVDPIHAGPLDTAFGGIIATPSGVLLLGSEGPPEERIGCQKLLGQSASIVLDAPKPPTTAISCGWGRDTHWWSPDGMAWQRLAPITPGPGESPFPAPRAIEFRVMTPGGPGIVNLGEDGLGNVLLWLSDDGRSWRADTPISPFRNSADMLSGVAVIGRQIIAVGETWDPTSGQPGTPAVWLGLAP